MKIVIPRPIETNTRIYGIGIRQFVYLGVGLAIGFIAAISVPADIVVRLIIAAFFLMIALALAFMKVNGHYVDMHLIHIWQYLRSPRTRVWNKEEENVQFVYEPVTVEQLRPKAKIISFELRREESVPVSLVIAAVNLLVLLIIGTGFYYMAYGGGWQDVQHWLQRGGNVRTLR